MATIPPSRQANLARLFQTANEAVAQGVVDATHKDRQRYWKAWCSFCRPHLLDPYLTGTPDEVQIQFLSAFTQAVRRGNYGRGHRVRAQSVQVALHAIGSAFKLDGRRNPTYDRWSATPKYWKQLSQQIEGYR